ncbi:hypothetical protein [Alterisphingorhabdus coralli]|uniref:DUF7847 domain-containing protein n=1 Tax=Alterisphingorhabdus coralli TaxID=3071408 RepID=A0AA97F8A4_9SPHN|nr:hypothetical protein [Parasphingorhabdus sp. SCSIO 66989]WOE75128.1 hypothetical protein RB602_15065 [Parasphingorhabdus sp. SCSIO 66989]
MGKTFDLGKGFNDAIALLTEHMQTILVALGLFTILPAMLMHFFIGSTELNVNPLAAFSGFNGIWVLVSVLLGMLGSLTIFTAFLTQTKTDLGATISAAAAMFLPYLLTNIIMWIGIGLGLVLLVIPGIFLMVKLVCASPIVAAEKEKNPIEALKRSWEMTEGNGMIIFAFLLIIGVGIIVISWISNLITLGMILNGGVVAMIGALLAAIVSAITSAISLAAIAAIYRQLAEGVDSAELQETFG